MRLILYCRYINTIGGIETYIYNMCHALASKYNITVLCGSGDAKQLRRLYDLVDVQILDKNTTYTCDVLIDHSAWEAIPRQIIFNKSYKVIHGDYRYFSKYGTLNVVCDADAYLAVSQVASESVKELYGIDATVIKNFMLINSSCNKILRLVSFTRLTQEKGLNHMIDFVNVLRQNNIPFEWHIYTNSNFDCSQYPELVLHEPILDSSSYIQNYDYLVQLSDTESFCYSVHEALSHGVPVIVGDIPAFKDIITNGYNGYKLNLSMKSVDVGSIYNRIPSGFKYDYDNDDVLASWMTIIGECDNEIQRRNNKNVKVVATIGYNDMELNRYVCAGEIIDVDYIRAIELCNPTSTRPAVCIRKDGE